MNTDFTKAAVDYYYLAQRGYPHRGFLELVGNRYALSNSERSMLYRGIVADDIARLRQSKKITRIGKEMILHIDCLNVITTVSSYLLGLPVFISLDSILRDASLKRGKLEKNPKLAESINLIMGFLSDQPADKAIFYIDEAGEITEKIVRMLPELFSDGSQTYEMKVVKDADLLLLDALEGVVCTSDSEIIDHSKCRIFDLARQTLENAFQPLFLDLKNLIKPM